jgi:hypothetical protein
MRLWTVHPRFLDPKGLTAAWREALLAQKVLSGATSGYRRHPQLTRFREQADPSGAIAAFLTCLADEARRRGYHFDTTKISRQTFTGQIPETDGQLLHEWKHLQRKLQARAPEFARQLRDVAVPEPNPLFCIVPGKVRDWERGPA